MPEIFCPHSHIFTTHIFAGLILCLMASASFLPLMAIFCKAKYRRSRRVIYDRLGGKLCIWGLKFAVLLLICQTIFFYFCTLNEWNFFSGHAKNISAVIADILPYILSFASSGIIFFLVLLIFFVSSKKTYFIPSILAFIILALGTVFDGAVLFYSACSCIGLIFGALILSLGLCGAAFFSLFMLILRRKADDFGRDYYQVAARFLAAAGLVGAGILSSISGLIIILYFVYGPEFFKIFIYDPALLLNLTALADRLFLSIICAFIFAVLQALIFFSIRHSQNPMRLKSFILGGYVLYFIYALIIVTFFALLSL